MCNRYRAIGREELIRYAKDVFGVDWDIPAPRYNIAPNQQAAIFVAEAGGPAAVVDARWNLMPPDGPPDDGYLRTNARAEKVLSTRSYREPLQKRRCLVPADGFYEWEHLHDGRTKLPWAFELNPRGPFAFAGLWERGDASRRPSFTILTTTPNALVARIHDRMPVMLSQGDAKRWLEPGPLTEETLAPFVRPFPPERMQRHRVSTAINSVRNDTAEAAAPANTDERARPLPPKPVQGELF